jgi:hypothetical protein
MKQIFLCSNLIFECLEINTKQNDINQASV